jgi:hypothetical protein
LVRQINAGTELLEICGWDYHGVSPVAKIRGLTVFGRIRSVTLEHTKDRRLD